jgi:hypothetical protein
MKAPGFNPCAYNMISWFQAFAFSNGSTRAVKAPGFNPCAYYNVDLLVSSLCFQMGQVAPLRRGHEAHEDHHAVAGQAGRRRGGAV